MHSLGTITQHIELRAEGKSCTFGDVSTEFLLYRKTCLQARQEKLAHEPAPKPAPTPAPDKNEHF